MATIKDRADEVKLALGNRSDITARIYQWLWESYLEIGRSINFEEQEAEVDDMFQVGISSYAYRDNFKAIKCITRLEQDGSSPKRLSKKNMINIKQQDAKAFGPPIIWAPLNRVFHVRPTPDRVYLMNIVYWTRPIQANPIEDTELLVTDDWLEVIDAGAIMRGHFKLLERNKAMEVRQLLYGDPKHPADKGLIARKKLEREAGIEAEDWGIKPRVHRYTNVL